MADEKQILEAFRAGAITKEEARAELAKIGITQPQAAPEAPQAPETPEAIGAPRQLAQNFNVALSETLGLPVNAVNAALQQIGFGSEQPFGGSESIKGGLESLGIGASPPPAQGGLERLAASTGRALGATAVPAGALLKAGQLVAPTAAGFAGLAQRAPGAVAAGEAISAIGSGVGEQVAREVAPESDIAPIIGSLAGGLTPSLGGQTVKRVLQGGPQGAENITATLDNLRGLGIETTPSLGVAGQGGAAQAAESAINRLPFGGRIQRSAEQTAEKLGKAVENITGTKELSAERAGSVIDRGLFGSSGFVQRFQDKAATLYGKLDKLVPAATPVTAQNTKNTIEELAGVVPGAEKISEVIQSPFISQLSEAFAQDIQKGSIPYSALSQIRSNIGRKLSGGDIIADAPRGELKKLYSAISDDLKDAARSASPEASKAFDNANNFYRSGLDRIENQFGTFRRKGITPEGIFKTATAGTAEGATRLRTLFKSLEPGERNLVADTFVRRLGRATPGRQDALGEVFSSETFLTNWNKLSNEAKDVMFAGRPQYRENLNQISDIAAKLRRSGRIGANPSGTAQGVAEAGVIVAAPAALFADAGTGGIIVGALTATNVASRLLTNPKFVNWAAKTARLPIERLPGQIARLSAQDDIDDAVSIEAFLEALQ